MLSKITKSINYNMMCIILELLSYIGIYTIKSQFIL